LLPTWPYQLTQHQRWAAAALIALAFHVALAFAVTRWAGLRPELHPGAAPLLVDLGELAGAEIPPAPPAPDTSPQLPESAPAEASATETSLLLPPTLTTRASQNTAKIKAVADPPPPVNKIATNPGPVALPPPPENAVANPANNPQAPQIGATSTAISNAPASWHNLLLAHLERHKHYPAIARQRRQQGIVKIQFSMDRSGQVLASEVTGSSGFVLLDHSALEMVNRAQPLPPPPAEISGKVLTIAVPVEFSLR